MDTTIFPVYQLYHFGAVRLPEAVRMALGAAVCGVRLTDDGHGLTVMAPYDKREAAEKVYIASNGTVLIPTALLQAAGIHASAVIWEEGGGYTLVPSALSQADPEPNNAPIADIGKWFCYYFENLDFDEICCVRNQLILARQQDDEFAFDGFSRRVEERIVLALLSKLMVQQQGK